MNKNFWLGILVAVVVIGGGYWFVTDNGLSSVNTNSNGNTTPTLSFGDVMVPGAPNTGVETPTQSTDTSSDTSSTQTPAGNPPTVMTDQYAVPSNSTAVVTGRVIPNGAPTLYWYEYGPSLALQARTASQAIGSGENTIPSPGYITGLSSNTTYYFRLSAENAYGTVHGATYSFTTNNNAPAPSTPPIASTNAATDVTRTDAVVNAHVNPNGTATTIWFEYGTTPDLGRVSSFMAVGGGTNSLAESATITGLNPLTKYYFRVDAQNEFGTVTGSMQSFTTAGPAFPGVPGVDTTAVVSIGSTTATFAGRVNPNGAQTSYYFEYSTDSHMNRAVATIAGAMNLSAGASTLRVSADATGLSHGTTYFVRLVAHNQYGTVRGDIVSFTTAH